MDNKKQWEKPEVKELEIDKTFGGANSSVIETTFNAHT